jgi:hypothetical protein
MQRKQFFALRICLLKRLAHYRRENDDISLRIFSSNQNMHTPLQFAGYSAVNGFVPAIGPAAELT